MPGIKIRLTFNQLRSMSEGDPAFKRQILTLVLSHTAETLTQVESSLSQADYKRLKEVTHKYKSSVNILSDSPLQKLLQNLENEATEGQNPLRLQQLVADLSIACQEVIRQVESELQTEE